MIDIILDILYSVFRHCLCPELKTVEWIDEDYFQYTEGNLNAALAWFRNTFENAKKIKSNVNALLEDIRQIGSAVLRGGKSIHGLFEVCMNT